MKNERIVTVVKVIISLMIPVLIFAGIAFIGLSQKVEPRWKHNCSYVYYKQEGQRQIRYVKRYASCEDAGCEINTR